MTPGPTRKTKRTRVTTQSSGETHAPGGAWLRDHGWPRFLSAPDPRLVRELYEPALSIAVRYDRCCSYFSSSVLSAAARGFGPFVDRLLSMGEAAPKPAIRLLVNEELLEQDVRALQERADTTALEQLLASRLGAARTALETRRLEMLTWLYARGYLDIRVGIMRQSLGLLHAKFGIITDELADALVFAGSGNESASGLRGNYEQIEVSSSWDDAERYVHYRDEFERLWQRQHPDVITLDLPDAIRDRLIRMAPVELPVPDAPLYHDTLVAAMRWQFIAAAPYLVGPAGAAACDATAFVVPWPHQRAVVEETVAAWPDGRLLCDEVGMGKTIEAVLVLRRLLHGRGVKRVLLLLPAGLMQQWQDELREKGGMIVPRFEQQKLVWHDGTTQDVDGLAGALAQPVVIMSRELARLPVHQDTIMGAEPWDLVLLDESHAARRAEAEESQFNSATLLLALLRNLQLRRRSRSFLLLSATPMQTQAWEPFDLLQVLGEGGEWLADFGGIRTYYNATAALSRRGECQDETADHVARLVSLDGRYPPPPIHHHVDPADRRAIAETLGWSLDDDRPKLGQWLRREAPLARRMHRNTRETLIDYHHRGLLAEAPPQRNVDDVRFDYADAREREVYDAVGEYIERRFTELEQEKPGKGFVMTIYRRRASSSPLAIQRSLQRRAEGLRQVIDQKPTDEYTGEADDSRQDIDEIEGFAEEPSRTTSISLALPDDPEVARRELNDVEELLGRLRALAGIDSKRDRFIEIHDDITNDDRPLLVFTEAVDTVEYLRDALLPVYGERMATYTGRGGQRWTSSQWKSISKQAVADMLRDGKLSAVVCNDAASEGLNLQAAGALVNYDLPWNPSRVEQRIGRIDRIGQKYREVRVVNLFLTDSVDDRVYQILSDRCGMFRHFVGAMQPVLAEARKVLLRGGGSLDAIGEAATDILGDPLATAIYDIEDANEATPPDPALTAEQLLVAFSDAEVAGVSVQQLVDGIAVDRLGATVRFSIAASTLADDLALVPLTPEHEIVLDLARGLRPEAPLLPLVVEAWQDGPFKAAVATWVHADGREESIEIFERLQTLLVQWDGSTPDRDALEVARCAARDRAAEAVVAAVYQAHSRQAAGLEAQVSAAKGRLMRELCRYIIARRQPPSGIDGDWMNQAIHDELSRQGPATARFSKAFEYLDGYPQWDQSVIDGIYASTSMLNEARRGSVLSLTSVDAALADPRWMARPFPFLSISHSRPET